MACGFGNLGAALNSCYLPIYLIFEDLIDSITWTKSHMFANVVSDLLRQPKSWECRTVGNFPTSHVGSDAGVLSPTSFACERTCSAVVGTLSGTKGKLVGPWCFQQGFLRPTSCVSCVYIYICLRRFAVCTERTPGVFSSQRLSILRTVSWSFCFR